MHRTRFTFIAVSAALAFAGVAGCGEDGAGDQTVSAPSSTTEAAKTEETPTDTSTTADATGEGSESESSSASGDAVEIIEFEYDPEEITVPAGTTVTFTNQDAAPHTATADDSSFDTENLEQGDSAEETFDEPGTYSYFCRFHVFMKGSVVVE